MQYPHPAYDMLRPGPYRLLEESEQAYREEDDDKRGIVDSHGEGEDHPNEDGVGEVVAAYRDRQEGK